MKFSVKHGLIAISAIALLMTALVSKSPLLIEIATVGTLLSIPLALVFAICDSNQKRRPFWIGFFVLSASCLLSSSYTGILHNSSHTIAQALCGPAEIVSAEPPAVTSPSMTPISVTPVAGAFANTEIQVFIPTTSANYNECINLLISFVPILYSAILGLVGGLLAKWISRPAPAGGIESREIAV